MRRVPGGSNAEKAIEWQFSNGCFQAVLDVDRRRREPSSNLYQGFISIHTRNWLVKRSAC
jgi:hypothetical protein